MRYKFFLVSYMLVLFSVAIGIKDGFGTREEGIFIRGP